MKNLYFVGTLLLFLITIQSNLNSQGTIRGTLLEEETGMGLIGANVEIEGTSLGAVTDFDGNFSIEDVPAGTYNLTCSFISYTTKTISDIKVSDGETTVTGNIKMSESSVNIKQVTVSAKAVRDNETAIQALQRKSINTLDGISNQAFSLRGDGDAAAAMKRVTGVSVQDGKYVYVRGLGDRYSKTTLNNANIPGLDPNKNTVQMDLFPTNLIDNIIVYKNFTPDLAGDFTGGMVDITTKDFPEKLTLNASIGISYNPQSNFNSDYLTYKGSSTDWLGYDNGMREQPRSLSNLPSVPEALSDPEKGEQLKNTTLGLNEELVPVKEMKPMNYSASISFGNQSKLFGKQVGYIVGLNYRRNYTGYSNGTTGRQTLVSQGDTDLNVKRNLVDNSYSDDVLIGGIFSGSVKLNNKNKISLSLIHNQAGTSTTRFQEGTVLDVSGDFYQERTLDYKSRRLSSAQLLGKHTFTDNFKVDWISSLTRSSLDQPDLRFINNVYNVSSSGSDTTYFIDSSEDRLPTRFYRTMLEYNWDNQLDMTYSFNQWNGRKSKLKFGGAYLQKMREFRDSLYTYSEGGNAANFNDYITADNVFSNENMDGAYITSATEPRNQYDSDMKIISGYTMLELPLTERLKSMIGARLEYTALDFKSYRKNTAGNIETRTLLDQMDILPAFSLIYEAIPDKMNIRLNGSSTVARPSFREIASIAMFDPVRNVIIVGNEDLKITNIYNGDIRWEYFFDNGEMISVSGFYKQFRNPIELVIDAKTDKQLNYQNVDKARVLGAELEVRKDLDFVNFLRDFSTGLNITYVYSEVSIPDEELEKKRILDPDFPSTRPMFGQSPYIINSYLQYINSGTKVNLSYNVQGPRLQIVSYDNTPDLYEQPFHSLNFKVSQSLGRGWNASVGVSNILNDYRQETQTHLGQEYIYNSYRMGRTYSLGLKYSIN